MTLQQKSSVKNEEVFRRVEKNVSEREVNRDSSASATGLLKGIKFVVKA